ncbi:hypothetical protein [Roseomonas sp. BN140053]|uniref:hypothetical protein n=1 Tax=Roseomonas sp. BN140053 TaxID=3391898 RepID=UPI0039E7953E
MTLTLLGQQVPLADIQANALAIIERHRDEEPMLYWGGLYDMRENRQRACRDGLTAEERLAKLRAEMTEAWPVAQLIRAAEFIAQAPRIASMNRKRGSYGWKHVAERFHKARDRSADYYVGEGMFIIAAKAMGLRMEQPIGHQHFRFNLSERSVTSIPEVRYG